KAAREGTRDSEHHVAPVLRILCVPEPLISHGHAAGKANRAIDHDRSPVIPAMKPCPRSELRHAEFLDAAAGLLERIEPIVRRPSAAKTVEEDAYFHTLTLLSNQSIQ